MSALTHLDAKGAAHMVDVGEKASTKREAIAKARLKTRPEVVAILREYYASLKNSAS